MSVLRTFVVVGFLVFFTSEFGFADLMYGKVGDSVVLKPDHKIDSITSVTWKHRMDLALEWFGGEITCYRTFDGRCELDETTGSFTIRNLTPEDSGEYTPEINNRVLGKKELKVIKPVPKPTVSEACNKEKTICNLTCEADITSEFGPVTYEWKTGDTELSTDKELSITEKNRESSFSCSLRNPVSNSASDEFPNPFNGEINTAGVAIGVVIGVLLLIGVVVLLVRWKTETKQSQNVETVYDEVSAVSLLTRRENADPTYGKVGGSVVLDPGQTSGPITSVTWKHRTDLALEWFGGEITCYRTFEGRCDLDQTTGSFTIRNLTPEDSGEYTPEINNRVLGKKELKVIKPVPKPTVSMACNKEKTVCNLTCEADITSEFGPVTYEWKTGDTELPTNEELSITEKNEESSFSCSLKNPVSNSASDEFPNPIITGNSDTTVIVLVALLLGFVVVAVIGAVFMNRAGYLPLLDKLFPCNEKARSEKRRAALMKGDAAEAASDTRQDDAAHVMMSLLSTKNETDQDQAAETPNGGLHKGNETLDDEAAGKPDDSTCAPSVDTQPEQEIISKGKEALNGHLIDNMNRDEEPNDPTCNPSVDQESNPDPSAVTPEPNSQTDSREQQQEPPAEQVGDDQGESGQNSRPEEPESTTEEPENNSNGEETLSGDQHANKNEDDSMEQQQQDAPAQQVGDDQGASGQNSRPEEPESNATGPETSPPESRSEETPDTDLAES